MKILLCVLHGLCCKNRPSNERISSNEPVGSHMRTDFLIFGKLIFKELKRSKLQAFEGASPNLLVL